MGEPPRQALRLFALLAGAAVVASSPAWAARPRARARAKAPTAQAGPARCPAGSSVSPEGTCSRCEGAVEKGRDACGDAHKKCVQRCEGAYQKCLRDPRALHCDNAQEKGTATCDRGRSACFTSKEKAYQACRLKEAGKR